MIALRAAWLFLKGVPLWVYLVIALLIGVLLYGVHEKNAGRAEVKAEWDADSLKRSNAEKAAVLARDKQNAADAAKQKADNEQITKAKNEEIDKLRADLTAAKRVRVGPSLCPRSAGQADTKSTGSSDAADPGAGLVSESTQRSIDALIMQVEEALATGRACQAFVTNNGMVP